MLTEETPHSLAHQLDATNQLLLIQNATKIIDDIESIEIDETRSSSQDTSSFPISLQIQYLKQSIQEAQAKYQKLVQYCSQAKKACSDSLNAHMNNLIKLRLEQDRLRAGNSRRLQELSKESDNLSRQIDFFTTEIERQEATNAQIDQRLESLIEQFKGKDFGIQKIDKELSTITEAIDIQQEILSKLINYSDAVN